MKRLIAFIALAATAVSVLSGCADGKTAAATATGVTTRTTTMTTVVTTTTMTTEPTTVSTTQKPTTVKTTAKTTTVQTVAQTTTAAVPHYVQKTTPTWNLRLVNHWNPMSKDYYQSIVNTQLTDYSASGKMDKRVCEALHDMVNAASAYKLCAAYLFRTVERSESNFSRAVNTWKSKGYSQQQAEQKVALTRARGYESEHNIGLAADMTCAECSDLNTTFGKTKCFQWLKAHCAEYGFILRYPEGKEAITGVSYEPWHYRYVGKEAATVIMRDGLTLEEYLEKING